MPKSFKKFRDEWDDEWGDDDYRRKSKDRKLRERRDEKRKKTQDKFSNFEERDDRD